MRRALPVPPPALLAGSKLRNSRHLCTTVPTTIRWTSHRLPTTRHCHHCNNAPAGLCGVLEANYAMAGLCFISYFFGVQVWDTPLHSLLPFVPPVITKQYGG